MANGLKTLNTQSIVIAAGARARPFVPPMPGLEDVCCLTSDTVWGLRELPRRLLVLGGGSIGSELTQAFARLGSQVTQVEMLPRILSREDPDVSKVVQRRFEREGVRVLTGHTAKRFVVVGGEKTLIAPTPSPATPSTISIARSPMRKRTDSSKCSRDPARTTSWV